MGEKLMLSIARFALSFPFLCSAVLLAAQWEKSTGGPVMRFVSPKLDNSLIRFKAATGVQLPIQKAQYPQIVLATSTSYLFGSVLLMANIQFGAWICVLTLTLTTLVMNNFWNYAHEPMLQQAEALQCLKNMAIVGGLLCFIATSRPHAPPRRHTSSTRISSVR